MLCFKWSLNLAYPISLGNKPKPKFVHFLINFNFIVCVQNVLSIIASKHKKKSKQKNRLRLLHRLLHPNDVKNRCMNNNLIEKRRKHKRKRKKMIFLNFMHQF